jgi:hypothetical protein
MEPVHSETLLTRIKTTRHAQMGAHERKQANAVIRFPNTTMGSLGSSMLFTAVFLIRLPG